MFSQACVKNSVHTVPSALRRPLQRTVRILLECILVQLCRISVGDSVSYNHTDRQRQRQLWSCDAWVDAWEWVWDPFWSVRVYSNRTLLLDTPLDTRCGYALTATYVVYGLLLATFFKLGEENYTHRCYLKYRNIPPEQSPIISGSHLYMEVGIC